ncbi:hypothetical protein PR002_g21212, partial [Phytophthora rubi]
MNRAGSLAANWWSALSLGELIVKSAPLVPTHGTLEFADCRSSVQNQSTGTGSQPREEPPPPRGPLVGGETPSVLAGAVSTPNGREDLMPPARSPTFCSRRSTPADQATLSTGRVRGP